jgi:transposase
VGGADVGGDEPAGVVEMEVLVDRVAGLDVHKKTVTACVRVPGEGRERVEHKQTFPTFRADLESMRDWLAGHHVSVVVMEATGVFWKPVWMVLEDAAGFELKLVNARHVKQVPGRKTDVGDAAWLARLAEVGLLRGSFVPPREIRELRDLTRYKKRLIQDRTREGQRVEKVLEDTGIKLQAVASKTLGMSGRAMLDALIAGERDPEVLADLAKGRLRERIDDLVRALHGEIGAHHIEMLRLHLDHIDYLTEAIARLDGRIEEAVAPFAPARDRLVTIPGIGPQVAETILAECGPDMSVFPTAAHLASWAGLCPGNDESGGKHRSGKTRPGNIWLLDALTQAAWSAARTDTFLAARFRRLSRRLGKKKAIVAVAHTMIVAVWHVLANDRNYHDLGSGWYDAWDPKARTQSLIRQLEALGHHVVLQPAA